MEVELLLDECGLIALVAEARVHGVGEGGDLGRDAGEHGVQLQRMMTECHVRDEC